MKEREKERYPKPDGGEDAGEKVLESKQRLGMERLWLQSQGKIGLVAESKKHRGLIARRAVYGR